MTTIKEVAQVTAKIAAGIVVLLAALVAYNMWHEQKKEDAYQAKLTAIMKPDPQNWQIVSATKGDAPAAWAINRATGTIMYCTADSGVMPSCVEANR